MSLAKRAITSTLWTSLTNYTAMGAGFVFGILRDRILQPYDSGVYAYGLATVDILFILSAVSFNISIIQADDNKEDLYSTAFVLTIILAILMGIVSLITAYIFYDRGIVAIKIESFLVLAGFSVLNLFSILFSSYLEKRLDYKRIARINLLAVLAFPIVSFVLISRGWGAWGMVFGQVSSFAISFIGMIVLSKYPFGIRFNFCTARWFLSMGWKLIFSRGMEVLFVQYGTFVIESMLGTSQQGTYNRVLKYWQMAPQTVAPAVVTVALPTYSKLQDDKEKLLQAFSIVIYFLIRVIMPFVLIFILIPESFIRIIGDQWLSGAPVLRILAIGALLSPLFENMKQMIYSQGQPEKILRTRLIQLVIFIPMMYFFVHLFGIRGAALATTLNFLVGTIGATILIYKIIGIKWMKKNLIPIIAAGITSLIVMIVPFPISFLNPIINFLFQAFIVVGIFLLLELSMEWKQLKEYLRYFYTTMKSSNNPDEIIPHHETPPRL